MSEHSLPENLAQWPDDAYAILGVERRSTPKDLKRSYTRLIKVYKPEHYPEHFRRIREAYESALRYVEFFGRFEFSAASDPAPQSLDDPENQQADSTKQSDVPEIRLNQETLPETSPAESAILETSPAEESTQEAASTSDSIPKELATPHKHSPTIDEAAELWDRAIRGEEAEAYRGLLQLHLAKPHQAAIILRLYWLLSLDPNLDSTRQPVDWLVRGFKSCGMHQSLKELYRREIEADPNEAVSPRFDEILDLEGVRSAIFDLYSWRFVAIRKLRRWDLLESDLPIARNRLLNSDQTAWFQLLLLAADATAWIRKGELWDKVNEEIRQMEHLNTQYRECFDRLDYLAAVRSQWHKIARGHPIALIDLVAESWQAPFHVFRPVLLKVLDQVDNDPKRWLSHFDSLIKDAPALMGIFALAMGELESRLELPYADIISAFSRKFLGRFSNPYPMFRIEIMEFCFAEGIDPIRLAQTILHTSNIWQTAIDPEHFNSLANDWPLHYVCMARRLFWS